MPDKCRRPVYTTLQYQAYNVIYTADFNGCKMKIYCLTFYFILLFAQNKDCGYTLEPLSTQSLCFRAKCLDFVNCLIKSSHWVAL